jgi:hypothetical protein
MNIHTAEDALFTAWRANHPGFVADGVVDEGAFLNSASTVTQ